MSAPRDPWADPGTPTQQGPPYAGPPPSTPYGYAAPPVWGPPPSAMPYGAPWAPPPAGPQRPAQVITAAVLAFVQAAVVLVASLYLWMFASIADIFAAQPQDGFEPGQLSALSREGSTLAIVQLVSAALLVGAGIWALNGRRSGAWWLLLAAHGVQVVLGVYWLVRLMSLPGDGQGAVTGLTLFFVAAPLTASGLLLAGAARRWFDRPAAA